MTRMTRVCADQTRQIQIGLIRVNPCHPRHPRSMAVNSGGYRGPLPMRFLFALLIALPAAAAEPVLDKQPLFEADTGGYATYRIPGLVVTDKGTLLAYCEARKVGAGDWGAIDLVYRRSADGGKTWSEAKKIVDVGGGFEKNPVAVNMKLGRYPDITIHNPVAIVDGGMVHFLYCVEYMRC